MRAPITAAGLGLLLAVGSTAGAQDHLRISVNAGEQTSQVAFKQTLKLQQYLEDGDLTLQRTIPKRAVFDGGVMVHIVSGLHAGVAFSSFQAPGSGTVTAHVPHPLYFGSPRTTTGDVTGIDRKETATHVEFGWTIRAAGGLEFTPFAGPSLFQAEQVFVTKLNLTLANEVYPYDTLAFPGATTETIKDKMNGYNAGVDMTWRFSKVVGVGALIRYTHGMKNFTPTGGQATKVEVGGLHAGAGLRVIF
jgi:hypothetical protein